MSIRFHLFSMTGYTHMETYYESMARQGLILKKNRWHIFNF